MNAIRKILGKYLNTWDEICLNEDARLRTNSIVFYFAIAVIVVVMAALNYASISGFVFFSGLFLAFISILFAVLQMRRPRFSIVISVVYFCYILMMSAGFILSSGEKDFSLMWLMIFPYVAWLVFNEVMALLFSALLMAITLVLLFFPFTERLLKFTYEAEFKNNFVAIMVFATASALISDLIRMKTRQRLLRITEQLRKRAYEDSLTGIGNRHDFERFMENRNFRCDEVYYAIVDIDRFKRINDTWGHAVGDEILRMVSDVLRRSIRQDDRVFRWGGEEFLIAINNMSPKHFGRYLDRIRRSVEQAEYVLGDGTRFEVTVSIGGTCAYVGEPSGDCIRRADDCMYEAKRQGRNRVVVHPFPPSPVERG